MPDPREDLHRELEELACLADEARAGSQDEDATTAAVLYENEAAAVEKRIADLEAEMEGANA